jgi:hypothetical protein
MLFQRIQILHSSDACPELTSELGLTLKPDPRSQQEINEQIVIIENITRGNS